METYYSGGGVWITIFNYEADGIRYYLCITNEDNLQSISKYRYVSDDDMFMPDTMEDSINIHDKEFEQYRKVYEVMKKHHLKEVF